MPHVTKNRKTSIPHSIQHNTLIYEWVTCYNNEIIYIPMYHLDVYCLKVVRHPSLLSSHKTILFAGVALSKSFLLHTRRQVSCELQQQFQNLGSECDECFSFPSYTYSPTPTLFLSFPFLLSHSFTHPSHLILFFPPPSFYFPLLDT